MATTKDEHYSAAAKAVGVSYNHWHAAKVDQMRATKKWADAVEAQREADEAYKRALASEKEREQLCPWYRYEELSNLRGIVTEIKTEAEATRKAYIEGSPLPPGTFGKFADELEARAKVLDADAVGRREPVARLKRRRAEQLYERATTYRQIQATLDAI